MYFPFRGKKRKARKADNSTRIFARVFQTCSSFLFSYYQEIFHGLHVLIECIDDTDSESYFGNGKITHMIILFFYTYFSLCHILIRFYFLKIFTIPYNYFLDSLDINREQNKNSKKLLFIKKTHLSFRNWNIIDKTFRSIFIISWNCFLFFFNRS